MKRSIIILSMLAIIGSINSYGQVAGPGDNVKIRVKGGMLCREVGPFWDSMDECWIAIGHISATHDLDSGKMAIFELPTHTPVISKTESPENSNKSYIRVGTGINPTFKRAEYVSTGFIGTFTVWFKDQNGMSFSIDKEIDPPAPKRPKWPGDVGKINKVIIDEGSVDTLEAADTADYLLLEFSDSAEVLIPEDLPGDSALCYTDNDGDGYGDPNSLVVFHNTNTCPSGYINNGTDCNDSDFDVNIAAVEACDGIDNNCDGTVDEGCNGGGGSNSEICFDMIDNDGDGEVDEGCPPARKGVFLQQDPVIVGESPNPFGDRVTINYSILENNTKIEMQVFDITGKLVTNLVKETQSSGDYRVEWTPESKVPFGIYHLKVNITSSTGEIQTINRKLIYNR